MLPVSARSNNRGAQGAARVRLHLRPQRDYSKTTFAQPIHYQYTPFHAMRVGHRPVRDYSENLLRGPVQRRDGNFVAEGFQTFGAR